MQNDEKILKILEALQQGQERLENRMDKSDDTQTRIVTALDAVKAGIEDVQAKQKEQPTKQDVETTVDAAKAEIKADLLLLESKVIKKIQSHERRITNIENQEQIENPEKH